MCGICGYLASEKLQLDSQKLLEQMNATLRHRGPDGEGYYCKGKIGLAMKRLAIIDVTGGQQPLANEDGSVITVFNGEIYNFRELRQELERYGHQFSTQSDTEVIVHAYEQWGDEALTRFNGMFALAVWDERQERLLIARDKMGKKPLFWHYSEKGLLWGSEAKALLVAPWVERRINALALHHYLTLQYTPDPLTIFEAINQLPAAHKLVVECRGKPQVSRWWRLSFEPKSRLTDEDAIVQARQLLGQAVERRLISEVPLGAFLSGGIDSSVIVALMAERLTEPVKTFSIGFSEPRYSETAYARQVANLYSTEHHEFIFQPCDLVNLITGVISATDEPFADPAILPLYELARQARSHVTVALCGDGGDDTLAGYRRYLLDGLMRSYASLPPWLTRGIMPTIAGFLPEPGWLPEDRNVFLAFKRVAQLGTITPKASIVRWGSYFSHDEKLALYTDRWRDEFAKVKTEEIIADAYDQAAADSSLDRTLNADHLTYLSGDLLPKTDRATMAHAIEARSPFLDQEWVEWTARLPERFKIRGLTTKWLLKMAFADKLPRAIINRSKQGFSIPIGPWLRGELSDWVHSLLLENQSLHEWFRPGAIEGLLREHAGGRINHGKRLWALLILAIWMNLYLKN